MLQLILASDIGYLVLLIAFPYAKASYVLMMAFPHASAGYLVLLVASSNFVSTFL
jgi:hypothetical protein